MLSFLSVELQGEAGKKPRQTEYKDVCFLSLVELFHIMWFIMTSEKLQARYLFNETQLPKKWKKKRMWFCQLFKSNFWRFSCLNKVFAACKFLKKLNTRVKKTNVTSFNWKSLNPSWIWKSHFIYFLYTYRSSKFCRLLRNFSEFMNNIITKKKNFCILISKIRWFSKKCLNVWVLTSWRIWM